MKIILFTADSFAPDYVVQSWTPKQDVLISGMNGNQDALLSTDPTLNQNNWIYGSAVTEGDWIFVYKSGSPCLVNLAFPIPATQPIYCSLSPGAFLQLFVDSAETP